MLAAITRQMLFAAKANSTASKQSGAVAVALCLMSQPREARKRGANRPRDRRFSRRGAVLCRRLERNAETAGCCRAVERSNKAA